MSCERDDVPPERPGILSPSADVTLQLFCLSVAAVLSHFVLRVFALFSCLSSCRLSKAFVFVVVVHFAFCELKAEGRHPWQEISIAPRR